MSHFEVYGLGPVSASVCSNLPLEEVTERLNRECPTGISSQWEWAEGEAFSGGKPNPSPCDQGRRPSKHYLFHC